MIYTTYFAKIKSLPKNVVPISICGKAPAGYKGLEYKKLAPKYDFFWKWKQTGDNEYYIKCYLEQVLAGLSVNDVVNELYAFAKASSDSEQEIKDIALVCYEKPTDFCHRHLVSTWLYNAGWEIEEYKVR